MSVKMPTDFGFRKCKFELRMYLDFIPVKEKKDLKQQFGLYIEMNTEITIKRRIQQLES